MRRDPAPETGRQRATARGARRLGAVAAALLAGGATVASTAATASASGWVAYDVLATADGIRATTFIPGGPLNDRVFDAGAPRAQARIDALGTSTAFASTVYPDELVLNVPGIAAGIAKQNVPPYPAVTFSSHPTQPATKVDAGPAFMEATSDADGSAAVARLGSVGTLATGSDTFVAVRRLDGQTLEAKATSVVEGLSVGPLTIGRLTSTATATRSPDGGLQPAVSTRIAGARVGQQEVTITREGLQAAEPARSRLADARVTVRWLDRVDSATSVTAPGIEITAEIPASLTGSGSSSVTLSLGRASVVVSGRPGEVDQLSADGSGGALDLGGFDDFAISARTEDAPAAEVAAMLDALTPAGSGRISSPAATVDGRPVLRVVAETWPAEPYVLFFAAAAILAVVALALHAWGIRSPWTS